MREIGMARAQKQSDMITDAAVPDPSPLPLLPGWKILVRPVSIVRKTKGGIILSDQVADDVGRTTTVGRVLKLGDMAYTHEDFGGKPWCKVGDIVVYAKLSGRGYLYKGVKLLLLDERAVDMVLESADDIDPNFHLTNY